MNVHKKLHLLRAIRNLTQQEVSERLHISQSTLSNIESGRLKLDMQMLERLADVYSVSLQSLLKQPCTEDTIIEQNIIIRLICEQAVTPRTDIAHLEQLQAELSAKDKVIATLLDRLTSISKT